MFIAARKEKMALKILFAPSRLKIDCRTRLMMPILGLASSIDATVNKIPGIMSGISESAKNSDLRGVLVRSLIHASVAPMKNASVAVPTAKRTEFQTRRAVSLLV